jgi:HK97 family phage portal protein
MNALLRAWAALRRRGPQSPAPESPRYETPGFWGQFGLVPGDLFLTVEEQMSVSVAWACIRAIVDPIAASELKLYEDRDGKRTEDRESWLYWLLNVEPHPEYTSQGWTERVLTSAVATGNGYAYIRRDGNSRPSSMQPLDYRRMQGDDEDGVLVYRYNDPVNGEVRIQPSDVIHVPGPRTRGFYGDSPMARAAAALALARGQEIYATSYYANGAMPGVLLKPPANYGVIDQDKKNRLREVWRALHGGPRKARGIGMLDPGWALDVVPTDAEKAQMVEARRYQVAEIARFFGVPGHLIGIPESSQGYGKNLAELGLGFVRQTLEPWARRVEEELRRKLMPGRRSRRWFIEYDLSRLKKGDEESVARAEEIAIRNGVLTINQAKELRGLPSVAGGDVTLVNGRPLSQVVAEPAEPKTNGARGPEEPGGEDDMAPGDADRAPMTMALEGHARRAKARLADLAAKGLPEAARTKQLASLRAKALADMRALMPRADARSLTAAVESVEHGVAPEKAAALLLGVGE